MKQAYAYIALALTVLVDHLFFGGGDGVSLAIAPFVIPAAAMLANTVIPIVADALLPEPELDLADRMASKRRELFKLTQSNQQQNFVDAAEILGDRVASTSRGGALSAAGDLRTIQRGVNRAGIDLFREGAAELSRGMIEDELTEIKTEFDQDVQSRQNTLNSIGQGLQTATSLATVFTGNPDVPDFDGNSTLRSALDITSGVNDSPFLNLDFDASSRAPSLDGLGVQVGEGTSAVLGSSSDRASKTAVGLLAPSHEDQRRRRMRERLFEI